MSTDKEKTEQIREQYIALQEKQIMKDPSADVGETGKELIEAEKQLKLLQNMIIKEEKESLLTDRLKPEIADKESESLSRKIERPQPRCRKARAKGFEGPADE